MIAASEDRLVGLAAEVARFDAARDWDQFHSIRNLTLAVMVEAGELGAHVQWINDVEIDARLAEPVTRAAFIEEMADVLIHLVQLSTALSIDLIDAAHQKLEINARKYPVDVSRGNPTKIDPEAPHDLAPRSSRKRN